MSKLIVLVLIQNYVFGQIQIPSKNGVTLFNNMMTDLFSTCRAAFGTIGFWSEDQIFLTGDQVDILVLTKLEVLLEPSTRRIKSLVVILGEFNPNPNIYLYEAMPTLQIETIFVFNKNKSNEDPMYSISDWFQTRFENSKFYYCVAMEERIDIITLNTFADIAPAFWTKLGEIYYEDDERWRFFKGQYTENTKFNYGPKLCEIIIFDRTKNLNGYKIKTAAKLQNYSEAIYIEPNELITKNNETSQVMSILDPTQGLFSKFLTDYLGVSVQIIFGMPLYYAADTSKMIMNGTLDFSLTPTHWVARDGLFTFSRYFHLPYPSLYYYNIIVTQNRGLSSPLEKMFKFYGWLTIWATLIIVFITFIVFYSSNSEKNFRLSFSVFECLRLIISNSIYTQMNTDRMRIFFSVIFLYFLIIQATFSGNLAAFLTKPEYRKNVETLEDLKDPRYTKIYAHPAGISYITDSVLLNKTEFGNHQCHKYISSNKSIACVDNNIYLENLINIYNLHTPKKVIKFSYAALPMRHNWPLKYRVNDLVMWLTHSGITNFWEKKLILPLYQEVEKKHDTDENYHRPIQIEDLMFAFYLLAVGLLSAFISFTVEYLINIYNQKFVKSRRNK